MEQHTMTNANGTPGLTPAGWYPDPYGAAPQRWWDGAQWTSYVSPASAPQTPVQPPVQPAYAQPAYAQPAYAQPAYAQPAYGQAAYQAPAGSTRPPVDPATPVGTVWIWLIVLLPVVTILLLPFVRFDFTSTIEAQMNGHYVANPFAMFGPWYFVLVAFSWLSYAATIVFSWLDYRELQRRGVVRPFHWAWSFLSSLVYVIGRTVIVRSVANRRGMAPMWAAIGVAALTFIVAIIWSILLIVSAVDQINSLTMYGA